MSVDSYDENCDNEDDNFCIFRTLLWIELDSNSWHYGIDTVESVYPIELYAVVVDDSSPISSTNIIKYCNIAPSGNTFNASTYNLPYPGILLI